MSLNTGQPTILYSKEVSDKRGDNHDSKTQEVHKISSHSGNFVVHIPVSREILSNAKYKEGDEFTQ